MNLKILFSLQQAVGVKVNVFYSTPTCYMHSLHKSNMTWTTMKTDFFPYASKQHEYWTGYYTSRPTLKYQSRKSHGFLQVCNKVIFIILCNLKSVTIGL